jgi:hypothetical protein
MAEFDPLGLVKAMGPQRDPYSWAELYAQDASKSAQLRDQYKNNLLLQEMQRAERAKEGHLDRTSREGIARQSSQDRRDISAERLKIFQQNRAKAERNFDFPPGSFPADAETAKSMGIGVPAPVQVEKTHRLMIRGPHKIYVPIGATVAPAPDVPLAPRTTDDGY